MVCCLRDESNVRNRLIDGMVNLLYYSCIKYFYFLVTVMCARV